MLTSIMLSNAKLLQYSSYVNSYSLSIAELVKSDIDFLVELKAQSSLFDYIGLMQDLATLLCRKVDIAEPNNLHELIRDKIFGVKPSPATSLQR